MKRFEALPVLQRLPPCLKWHHRSKTQLHKIYGNVGIPVLWRLQRKERLVWNEEEEAPSLVWRESQDPQQHYPQVRRQFPRDETRSQKTQRKTNTCTKRNAKTLSNITPIRGRSNMATPPPCLDQATNLTGWKMPDRNQKNRFPHSTFESSRTWSISWRTFWKLLNKFEPNQGVATFGKCPTIRYAACSILKFLLSASAQICNRLWLSTDRPYSRRPTI